jgi:hypothetical protein
LLPDVYTMLAAPAPDSAQHRILLTWKPTAPDHVRIALQDDCVYLVFYRFVFALSPKDYALRWVYVHDADLVGATAQQHGLAFADDAGRFGFLGAASGELAYRVEGGPSSTVVRLPRGGSGVRDSGRAVDGATVPGKLLTAAHDQDARLVPARLLVVEELARLDVPEATANLIELCDAARIAPPVRERACALLKQRVIGSDHLLFALERHAGYLEGTTSPPVGALAKAAASLKEKRAVALLIAHLKDPNTRSSDLPAVVTALGELEDPAAADPLVSFLRLYHADTIDEHLLKALELIPGVLVKLQGPVAKPPLEEVMYDELGAYTVRQKARTAVDGLAALEKAAQLSDEAAQAQQEQAAVAEEAAANPDAYLPTHLTTELIEGALLPVRDPLRACLSGAAKPTFQARVVLVVEDGKVLMVSVLPPELQACIEPLVRAQPFPRTKFAKQERLIYTLKR